MIKPLHQLLTVVLISRNRPDYLVRALRYYSGMPYALRVLDCSAEPGAAVVEQYGNERTEYRHCGAVSDLAARQQLAWDGTLVRTPYVIFVADDAFTLQSGIEQSVAFLQANPDYALCHGYALAYQADGERVHYFLHDRKGPEDHAADPLDRAISYMANYLPPAHAVFKSSILADWLKLVPATLRPEFHEFGEALYGLLQGKARILPVGFRVSALDAHAPRQRADLYAALTHPGFDGEERTAIFNLLADAWRKADPVLSASEAAEHVVKAAAALALSLGAKASDTTPELFHSEWKGIAPRPEWLFEPRQHVELPFYSTSFFSALDAIDLLVRAVPCGEAQLKDLEPKLQWQNQLLVKGIGAMDAGDTHSAQQAFEAILSQNPFHINTVCSLCVLFFNAGKHAQAKALLAWANQVDARNPAVTSLAPLAEVLKNAVADTPIKQVRRLAVLCHLYSADAWASVAGQLQSLTFPFDLIVTTSVALPPHVAQRIEIDHPGARIQLIENRGRDIGALFKVMESETLEDYSYVLKIHAGAQAQDGVAALESLLPKGHINDVLTMLDIHAQIGLLGPAHSLLGGGPVEAASDAVSGVGYWVNRLGLVTGGADYSFISGDMFWMRGQVLRELRTLGVRQADFEPELGQLDGTLAHTFTRVLPLVARKLGLNAAQLEGSAPRLEPVKTAAPTVIQSPYAAWLQQRTLTINEAKLIDQHTRDVPAQPLRLYVIDRFGHIEGITASLNAIGQQFHKPVTPVIVSPLPNPEPGNQQGLHWVQSEGAYQAALQDLADNPGCNWVGFIEAGDRITRQGVLLGLFRLGDQSQCQAIYWDDDWLDDAGQPHLPRFKPDYSPDMMRAMPYADGLVLARPQAIQAALQAGPLEAGAEQIDLLLRVQEQFGTEAIGHVTEPGCHLAQLQWRSLDDAGRNGAFARSVRNHLARSKTPATIDTGLVPGTLHVRYQHETLPLVSIIVPTKDQFAMLSRCVESVLGRTRYPHFELLIVDNNTGEADALAFLDGLEKLNNPQVRVLRYPHPFNFSAINNFAVNEARGDYVVLLNNDTAVVQESWLEELVANALRPEVGIVGARLLYPNGTIQHAGVVAGLRGPADHPFIGLPKDASGYMNRLQITQNYSVVTAACLIIRKSVYQQAGGMDEGDFKVSYNDVDLCLKVRQAGYLVVWTPFATVLHEGSVSQLRIDPAAQEAKKKRFEREQEAMYLKWLPQMAHDPYYNRNLLLHGNGFELEHRRILAFEPVTWKPPMRVLAHPADQMGCGHYRIIQPFQALEGAQKASGALSVELLAVVDQERFKADVLVFQRQITTEQIEFMARAKRLSGAYCIYELDDYLPNIPLKSAHREHMPKDVLRSLRRAVAHVDRFVVSTERLAEQYADLHDNFHVVHNYLPETWWGNLPLVQTERARPRVGWAGGVSHTGDLELIEGVVRELANEVDWVFFGMCPPKLRPYIKEMHEGVPIEGYPAKLASLQLDLALAPLEHNVFNESKSNLRLLEYGACGFPVVCTDIEPYRVDLPVTRVRNRHKDWVDAIRMHLADLPATRQRGIELREAIYDKWMLKGDNLELWRKAWAPD